MACICANLLTEGIDVLCENNAGGILDILVSDKCNIAGFEEAVEGIVDTITMESGSRFWRIETQRLTASFEENENNNFDNGSKFFDHLLNIVVARRDVARRNSIAGLGAGQKDLVFLVKDSNGTWWEQGISEGMKLLTSTGGSGTKKEDLNGYTIQFQGQSSDLMSTVDPLIIDALLIVAP